jgi:hypothetical protein
LKDNRKELTTNDKSAAMGAAMAVPAREATRGKMARVLKYIVIERRWCAALEVGTRKGQRRRGKNKRPRVD